MKPAAGGRLLGAAQVPSFSLHSSLANNRLSHYTTLYKGPIEACVHSLGKDDNKKCHATTDNHEMLKKKEKGDGKETVREAFEVKLAFESDDCSLKRYGTRAEESPFGALSWKLLVA